MSLWHFTCADHGLPGIRETGELRPNELAALPLVWLTDLAVPSRDALGLTSWSLSCDRTEVRVPVPAHPAIEPWWTWRRAHPELRPWAELLEAALGARPAHWLVSASPLPIDPKELPS